MMKGHLASQGFRVSESRIGQSLKRVCRDAYEAHWSNTIDCVPVRYQAHYFGYIFHVDQNQGVTHVAATDGHFGKIISFLTTCQE